MTDDRVGGTKLGYMETLDALLALGTSGLGPEFTARQARFVKRSLMPDGGFRGRDGQSDLYYTDFALRVLDLHSTLDPDLPRVASWLSHWAPRDVVDVFGLLNSRRLLEKRGVPLNLDMRSIKAALDTYALEGGGYTRESASILGPSISVYATFIAALACEILGVSLENPEGVISALKALQRADGGFAESPAGKTGQTSATAGALGVLSILDAAEPQITEPAIAYLTAMQTPNGGLRAFAGSPTGDLLSTFTGSLALFGLEALGRLDLRTLGRFVRDLAIRDGGFLGFTGDVGTDVEYTFYGIGTLAILQAYILACE